jgi:hypothetical protein
VRWGRKAAGLIDEDGRAAKGGTFGSSAFFRPFSRKEVKRMKKVIYVTIFVSLLAFFSSSGAQDLPRLFSGRIQKVDSAGGTIVVMVGEKTMVFQISKDTRIKTDLGEDMPFNQLQVTMSVVVEYMKEGDKIHPLSIKVNTLPTGYAKNKKQQQFDGVIQKVQEEGRNIIVADGEKTMNFPILQDTKINVPFAELKSGMPVSVEYLKKGALNYPLSINARSTKAMSRGTGKKQKGGK